MYLRNKLNVATTILLIAGCAADEENIQYEQIVIKTDQNETAITVEKTQRLSLPDILVDNENLQSPSELLDAWNLEFSYDGENVLVERIGTTLTIKTASLEKRLGYRADGNQLTIEGIEIQTETSETAGLVLFSAIVAQLAVDDHPANEGRTVNKSAATACRYICYEVILGGGYYVCRYYPRGLYYGFEVQIREFPCFAGAGYLNFTCEYFPLYQYATCSGNGA